MVKRELKTLTGIGITTKDGNDYLIDEKSSIAKDLKNLFVKTDYAVNPISKALENQKVEYAFIFRSYAKGTMQNNNDIGLFVIGDQSPDRIMQKLKTAEDLTGRQINPIVWTKNFLLENSKKSFIKEIAKNNIIMVKGDEKSVRTIIG